MKTTLGEETLLVPGIGEEEQFHGVIRLNETAAFITELLRKNVTEEEIIEALLREYDVERPVAEKHVKAVLNTLRSIGALAD